MSRLRRFVASAGQVRRGRFAAWALAMLAAVPSAAAAQTYVGAAEPRRGTIEIGGGAVWMGGYDAGSRSATETPNSSTGAPPITLFTTSARVPAVTGADVRAAVYLGSRLSAEGLFQYAKPTLRVDADDDFENAAPVDVVGGIAAYLFGGSLVYHFGSGKVVPYILGGGGYVRLLDEDNAEVVTGSEVHGGGGVKMWFGAGRRFGVRADAQVSSRSKSPGFEDKRRALPTFAAGLLYKF